MNNLQKTIPEFLEDLKRGVNDLLGDILVQQFHGKSPKSETSL